jgi:hypothetical protein
MKKLSVLLVAAIMVLALTMPAAAFKNEFGGFWRTRAFSEWGYTGDSQKNNQDIERIDTRTRIFYTAKFSDNLKFVNKFEFNSAWGQSNNASSPTIATTYGNGTNTSGAAGAGFGQLGADGANVVVKASYVDFKLAQQRFTVGIQDFMLARSYLFDDDAAGVKAIFKVNDAIYLPLIYMKIYEGGQGTIAGTGQGADNYDVNAYVFYPTLYLNKDNVFRPHVAYITSENFTRASSGHGSGVPNSAMNPLGITQLDLWSGGLEWDGKFDIWSFGATAIGEFGSGNVDPKNPIYNHHDKINFKGYLFDARAAVDLGPANIHLKGIYASGDGKKDALKTGDEYAFIVPGMNNNVGANYNNFDQANWAEIMGAGMFDYNFPSGGLGTQISNAIIGGLGGSYKLIQDLKLSADIWYAQAADSIYMPTTKSNSDYYGTELDLKLTYTIVDNLKIDLVGAYLWAGDVIQKSQSAVGSANPVELGAQMSLAF